MTQEHLGDTLGVTAVHVNRVLARLRADEMLFVAGREVLIPDFNRLAMVGGFNRDYIEAVESNGETY